MIHFNWYHFSELKVEQLYAVLSLRSEVFVVEQECVYLDPDGKDPSALHLLGMENNKLAAYLRLFHSDDYGSFGRVVTSQSSRGKGYGKRLIGELLNYWDAHYPKMPLGCSAQYHLTQLYSQFGFKTFGDVYDEDGIPHIAMQRMI